MIQNPKIRPNKRIIQYYLLFVNPHACVIIRDEGTTSIVRAFTREGAGGKGIATALLDRSLEWARAEGYERCAVDMVILRIYLARSSTMACPRSFHPLILRSTRATCFWVTST